MLCVMEEVGGLGTLVLLGGGGFADVYRAHEPAFSRDVAVKVFHDHLDDRGRRSFEREASAAGRLSGIRNVVHVYRSDVTPSGRPYLVMELMYGSLGDALARGPIPVPNACAIGALLGTALGEAHARGVLHRDIKPANVLVDRYGEPALTDFGIASLPGPGPSITLGGAFTAEHAAPEFFDGAPATEASDVYSLASTLFTMMEGQPPFRQRDDEGPLPFMQRVKSEERPICAAAVQHSAELDALLRSALSTDPVARPRLGELVAALQVHAGSASPIIDLGFTDPPRAPRPTGGAATSPPPLVGAGTTQRGDRSAPWGRVLAVAAVVVVGGILGTVALMSSDGEPETVEAAPGSTGIPASTTAAPTTSGDLARPTRLDGVANARPSTDSSLVDTSAILRAGVNAFAAGSSFPVLAQPPLRELTGAELNYGKLPATFDYTSTNRLTTTKCLQVQLDGMVVVGAAGGVWSDGSQLVLLNVVEMPTELLARRYFWATSMFLGLRDNQCDGWPADKVAFNPDDLEVNRLDFPIEGAGEDAVSVVNDEPTLGGISAGIAYESATRVGNIVIVANIGFAGSGADADPATAAAVISEAIAAFDQDS